MNSNDSQQKIIDILNTYFAEEYVLLTKKERNWNVEDRIDLHKFLKVQYKDLLKDMKRSGFG
jgi:DNA-binding ferritin-like protein